MTYISMKDTGYETHLAESDDLLKWKPLGKILRFKENTWDARQVAGCIILAASADLKSGSPLDGK
jgi:hypothetical protein